MTALSQSATPPPLQLLVLFLVMLLVNLSTASPISLQLHRISPSSSVATTASTSEDASSAPDPYKALAALATASLLRARHLKNRTTSHQGRFKPPRPSSATRSQAPLSPHAYGGYTVTLALGTPPQAIPLVFDTGSDLTWVPCTNTYSCSHCPGQDSSTGGARVFLPKASSTARLVGCRNPKCGWIHSPQTIMRRCAFNCSSTDDSGASNCTTQPQICPPYLIMYGSGSTGGVLLSETLHLSGADPSSSSRESSSVPTTDFAVGCSVFSSHQPPAGIAGFGRGPSSFGSQLHLSSFSYCLASRRFDDVPGKAGTLVLNGNLDEQDDTVNDGDHSQRVPQWFSTPFLQNLAAAADSPSGDERNVYGVYYYVGLRRITVGGNKVKVPQELLVPGSQGDGGAIIDSGSTFTYMEPTIMRLVAQAFEAAVAGQYNRSKEAESRSGLSMCFDVSDSSSSALRLPELELHFKGGASMDLPLENYFAIIGNDGAGGRDSAATLAVCLMVVSDKDADEGGSEPRSGNGPSIILGAFQQQNYRMVFDLNKKRLRFRSQRCSPGA